MSGIQKIYDALRAAPWPTLAGKIGDFALYEALLMGYADRAVNGEALDASSIPAPDNETISYVSRQHEKTALSDDEREFLLYFEVLESLRLALTHGDRR
jgi:hypothetical protein